MKQHFVFHDGKLYEVPEYIIEMGGTADIEYIQYKKRQAMAALTEAEIEELWNQMGFSKDEIDRIAELNKDTLWYPDDYYKKPEKKKCECGVSAVIKDALPHQHSTYCPLYEKKKD